MKPERTYKSPLREAQTQATRERIVEALADLLKDDGRLEAATYKAVAERAGVTEITVYRHFPNRDVLLKALWHWLNTRAGVTVGMPRNESDLTQKLGPLFASFDAAAPHIRAAMFSPQGREMRESLNAERRDAFLAALGDATHGLPEAERRKAAAVIQLLYSAYAWLSMREQWDLEGQDAADAAVWAITTLIEDLKGRPRETTS